MQKHNFLVKMVSKLTNINLKSAPRKQNLRINRTKIWYQNQIIGSGNLFIRIFFRKIAGALLFHYSRKQNNYNLGKRKKRRLCICITIADYSWSKCTKLKFCRSGMMTSGTMRASVSCFRGAPDNAPSVDSTLCIWWLASVIVCCLQQLFQPTILSTSLSWGITGWFMPPPCSTLFLHTSTWP